MTTIDLTGPEGNAFALMGTVRRWAKQLGEDPQPTLDEMMSGDYDHLVDVMAEWAADHHIDLDLVR